MIGKQENGKVQILLVMIMGVLVRWVRVVAMVNALMESVMKIVLETIVII